MDQDDTRSRDLRARRRLSQPALGDQPTPVLFLGGTQRSGSTLLDRMMSQLPGYVSAGEVVHLWTRGVRDHELCGCGLPFDACPFWSEVGRIAFGGWDRIDVDGVIELQRKVDRNRYIFFMLLPSVAPRYSDRLRAYADILDRLMRAIAECGGGVVVDSSKHASTAFLLRRIRGVRLRVIHLVRDSRGVAYSLGKRVRRPEVRGTESFMHREASWRAALEWSAFNGLFHLLRWMGTPVARLRYEDLISDPAVTVRSLDTGSSLSPDGASGFIDGSTVELGVDHTVAGNPMRFVHGSIELKPDHEWETRMSRRDRWVTTAFTAPMLAAYGYRLKRT